MFDFYQKEWLEFGELLTEIEAAGIRIDIDYLKQIEVQGLRDYENYKATFLNWATKYCPEASFMNIESDSQKQQLLFAPTKNRKNKHKSLPEVRTFETPNIYGLVEPGEQRENVHSYIRQGETEEEHHLCIEGTGYSCCRNDQFWLACCKRGVPADLGW